MAFEAAIQQLKGRLVASVHPTLDEIFAYLNTGQGDFLERFRKDPRKLLGDHFPGALTESLPPPSQLGPAEIRLLHLLAAGRCDWSLEHYAQKHSKEIDRIWEAVQGHIGRGEFLAVLATGRDGITPAAGRHLAQASLDELRTVVQGMRSVKYSVDETCLQGLRYWLDHEPRLPEFVADLLVGTDELPIYEMAELLMEKNGPLYEPLVAAAQSQLKDSFDAARTARALYKHAPEKYRELMLKAGRRYLKSAYRCHEELGAWFAATFGREVLKDLVAFMNYNEWAGLRESALQACVRTLGPEAEPVAVAAVKQGHESLRQEGVRQLGRLGRQEDLCLTALRQGLKGDDPDRGLKVWLDLCREFPPEPVQEELWGLLNGPHKALHRAAAGQLARLGPAVRPRLEKEKPLPAIRVLAALGDTAELETRLEQEKKEDLRDEILLALERAWEGRAFPREQLLTWAARARATLPKWLGELPALRWKSGEALAPELQRHLLYRQSRATGPRLDVEARAWLQELQPSPAFAAALLEQYLAAAAKERWPLPLVAVWADEATLGRLVDQIPRWAEGKKLKMAEEGIAALALNGSNRALEALDHFSRLWANKNPSLGRAALEAYEEAARREGVSPAELGDRIVPRLGLPLQLEGTDIQVEAGFKPTALPRKAGAASKQIHKELTSRLKEVGKSQSLRLQTMMVAQHRWPAATWKALFLDHPVLLPFARSLVWRSGDATFRVLDDLSLTDADDNPLALPSAAIGILHPLEVPPEERDKWRVHLHEHGITPPFAQLDRPVFTVDPTTANETFWRCDAKVNGLTLRGRLERAGWRRGEVESGAVLTWERHFPAAGLVITLETEGLYFGMERDDQAHMGRASTDPATPLGELPPLIYSEVTADLQAFSGL